MECPITEDEFRALQRRLAVLDGNGFDRTGGSVGRLEKTVVDHDTFIDSVKELLFQLKGAVWALIAVALILGVGNGALLLKVLDKIK